MAELARRLQSDPTALRRFYLSFGLDPEKLPPYMLNKIAEFFPHTPVKLLRDVLQELQLYDLVEMLEKVKWRSLRPSLPLKEMKKLLNASERPTKFYSKAEVLVIEYSDREAVAQVYPDVERIGCFFQALNSQSKITRLTAKFAGQKENELVVLRNRKRTEERLDLRARDKEVIFKEHLQKQTSKSDYNVFYPKSELATYLLTEEERSAFQEGPAVIKLLDKVIEERGRRKVKIEKIVKEIQQKEEELKRHQKGENKKFKMAVSTVTNKWIHQAKDEGMLICNFDLLLAIFVLYSSLFYVQMKVIVTHRKRRL